MQPNREQVAELKKNPVVAAWIEAHQKDKWHMPGDSDRHADCRICGWPHDKHVQCGMGATFGFVQLGRHPFSIDASNVEYMLHFTEQLAQGRGFHWRDETFFGVKDGKVVVTYLESFNNSPQLKTWTIPLNEWRSIVKSVDDAVQRQATVSGHG